MNGHLALVSMVLLVLCCVAAEPEQRTQFKLSKPEKALLDLTNKARAKKNLPPLKPSPILFRVARQHAANMAKHEEMNHVLDGKNTIQRIQAAGYDYAFIGENVAVTYGGLRPASIFESWMNSKIHRSNILRKTYTQIGIGIARSKNGDYYYAQEFGTPRRHQR